MFFLEAKLDEFIQSVMSQYADFVHKINNIIEKDVVLAIRIRQAIHELEKAPSDEVAIEFLSDCLIIASKMATKNALNNIPDGVLNKAIEYVLQQFQQERGEIPSDKIYNALNLSDFFEPHLTTRKVKDKGLEPIDFPFCKK